jgi:hypothetical protein
MSNIWTDDWDDDEDWSGGGGKSKRLVPNSDQDLGASLYELGPENFNVLHFHHGSEELLIVLRGRPTLRTAEGERASSPRVKSCTFQLGPTARTGCETTRTSWCGMSSRESESHPRSSNILTSRRSLRKHAQGLRPEDAFG